MLDEQNTLLKLYYYDKPHLILFNEMRYENNYVYAFKCDSKFTSCGTEVYFEFSSLIDKKIVKMNKNLKIIFNQTKILLARLTFKHVKN